LTDLQGPKLRIGTLEGGAIELVQGATIRVDLDKTPGNSKRLPLPHPEIFAAISEGTDLLLDDGKLRLRVTEAGSDHAVTEVITGGKLINKKGLNVPNAMLPISALTPKDREDLTFALDLGIDYVGLSFVQRPEDIAEARRLIAGRAAIMSKLEKPAAIENCRRRTCPVFRSKSSANVGSRENQSWSQPKCWNP
jgi:pyruvate kinase